MLFAKEFIFSDQIHAAYLLSIDGLLCGGLNGFFRALIPHAGISGVNLTVLWHGLTSRNDGASRSLWRHTLFATPTRLPHHQLGLPQNVRRKIMRGTLRVCPLLRDRIFVATFDRPTHHYIQTLLVS